ncbi:MAG: hypothetical protein WA093_01075 [Minisyncoccales bacterium]
MAEVEEKTLLNKRSFAKKRRFLFIKRDLLSNYNLSDKRSFSIIRRGDVGKPLAYKKRQEKGIFPKGIEAAADNRRSQQNHSNAENFPQFKIFERDLLKSNFNRLARLLYTGGRFYIFGKVAQGRTLQACRVRPCATWKLKNWG